MARTRSLCGLLFRQCTPSSHFDCEMSRNQRNYWCKFWFSSYATKCFVTLRSLLLLLLLWLFLFNCCRYFQLMNLYSDFYLFMYSYNFLEETFIPYTICLGYTFFLFESLCDCRFNNCTFCIWFISACLKWYMENTMEKISNRLPDSWHLIQSITLTCKIHTSVSIVSFFLIVLVVAHFWFVVVEWLCCGAHLSIYFAFLAFFYLFQSSHEYSTLGETNKTFIFLFFSSWMH